jgi:RecJ-like exonuclease
MKKLKWVICKCCEGNGTVDNPAFSNGFTSSEWKEMHEDEQAAYMAGEYNVACTACNGSGKVQVPDVAAMTFAEKRNLVIQRRESREEARISRQLDAEWAAERAFGC